jgi:hypothetical protein
MTGEGCPEDDKAVKAVEYHIGSMRAVIREEIFGDGGEVGRQLVDELQIDVNNVGIIHWSPLKACKRIVEWFV